MRAREPTACMIWRMQTRVYVGVGAGVGDGVGLHAQTPCCMLPLRVRPTIALVAAQIGLSPGADVDQYRRSPSAVPAQM